MVRISKQSERRARNPHRCRPPSVKTGPRNDTKLQNGFKDHANALEGEQAALAFIPKIK
jgi:hypothetical protein